MNETIDLIAAEIAAVAVTLLTRNADDTFVAADVRVAVEDEVELDLPMSYPSVLSAWSADERAALIVGWAQCAADRAYFDL